MLVGRPVGAKRRGADRRAYRGRAARRSGRPTGAGGLLLKDILVQLARPGRDPREDLPQPIFKKGVIKLDDLTAGMELQGTVLNVVDFGAFVDIGLHDTGLVHISQLANQFVRDPHDVVSVGDTVKVWVHEIDKTRRRVSLTMIAPGTERGRRHGAATSARMASATSNGRHAPRPLQPMRPRPRQSSATRRPLPTPRRQVSPSPLRQPRLRLSKANRRATVVGPTINVAVVRAGNTPPLAAPPSRRSNHASAPSPSRSCH